MVSSTFASIFFPAQDSNQRTPASDAPSPGRGTWDKLEWQKGKYFLSFHQHLVAFSENCFGKCFPHSDQKIIVSTGPTKATVS